MLHCTEKESLQFFLQISYLGLKLKMKQWQHRFISYSLREH